MSRQSFVGHSGHMAEPTQLGSLDSEKWFDIQGFANFTVAHFVAQCHILNSIKIPSLPLALEIIFFWSLPKIHDHK